MEFFFHRHVPQNSGSAPATLAPIIQLGEIPKAPFPQTPFPMRLALRQIAQVPDAPKQR